MNKREFLSPRSQSTQLYAINSLIMVIMTWRNVVLSHELKQKGDDVKTGDENGNLTFSLCPAPTNNILVTYGALQVLYCIVLYCKNVKQRYVVNGWSSHTIIIII